MSGNGHGERRIEDVLSSIRRIVDHEQAPAAADDEAPFELTADMRAEPAEDEDAIVAALGRDSGDRREPEAEAASEAEAEEEAGAEERDALSDWDPSVFETADRDDRGDRDDDEAGAAEEDDERIPSLLVDARASRPRVFLRRPAERSDAGDAGDDREQGGDLSSDRGDIAEAVRAVLREEFEGDRLTDALRRIVREEVREALQEVTRS